MLAFTICYIRRGTEVLLLNREKGSWMGRWNGIGGKLESGESPRESILREAAEETGITGFDVRFCGTVRWRVDGHDKSGMYVFVLDLPEEYHYVTPRSTAEGILDWKRSSWIRHPDNEGLADNVRLCLAKIEEKADCFDILCRYEQSRLVHYEIGDFNREESASGT